MKRVSFEVAKAIKEAGYPQGITKKVWTLSSWVDPMNPQAMILEGSLTEPYFKELVEVADAPYYLEVWLWLWKEKKECINVMTDVNDDCRAVCNNGKVMPKHNNPEEAIIAAIEYLVKNDLIK